MQPEQRSKSQNHVANSNATGNMCSRQVGTDSRTQLRLWSRQALRCVSAQCSITLAPWVGVCLCAQGRGRIVSDASCVWTVRVIDVVIVEVFSTCGCSIFKGSGSSHSPLPASLFEHTSIGQANNRTTQRTTQRCEVRALTPPSPVYPPHVCHCQGSLQRLAHAAGHGQHSSASTP